MAGMREHRIMFSDAAWKMIQQEARASGVSAGQFIREASIAYAVWRLAQRGGNDPAEEIERIIEQLRSDS